MPCETGTVGWTPRGRRLAGSHPALPLVLWGLETNRLLFAAPPLESAGSRWHLAGQHPLIGPGCLNVLQRSPVEAPAPWLFKREGCDQLAMSAVAQTGRAQTLHLTSGPMEAKSHSSSGILLNLKNIQPVIKAPMMFLLRLLTKSSDVIFYQMLVSRDVCSGPILCYSALPFRLEHPLLFCKDHKLLMVHG